MKGQPEEVGRNAAHEEELQQIAKVPWLAGIRGMRLIRCWGVGKTIGNSWRMIDLAILCDLFGMVK